MSRTSEAFKNLKKVIPAITFARKADVKKYLKAFNLDLDREEHKCAICGRKITPNNIGIIVSDGEKPYSHATPA